jgi:hypothetical protein
MGQRDAAENCIQKMNPGTPFVKSLVLKLIRSPPFFLCTTCGLLDGSERP